MTGSKDEWIEWSKYVLEGIKDINKRSIELDKKVNKLSIDIATLKVKAGIWGLIGGSIPVFVGLAIWILKGG